MTKARGMNAQAQTAQRSNRDGEVAAKWKHEAICPPLFFPLKLKESIAGPHSLALGST